MGAAMTGRARVNDGKLGGVGVSSRPPIPPPLFDGDAARWSARRIGSGLIDAARLVAGRFPPPHPVVVGALACGFFGPDGDGHALRYPPLYIGFTPHEPQITKALAHFLNGEGDAETRVNRVRSFIAALFAVTGRSAPPPLDLDSLDRGVTVETEERFQPRKRATRRRDRRIDLLVRWTGRDGKARGALVEAKFGHHATKDQLPAMRAHAIERFDDLDHAALFVVAAQSDRLAERNRDWTRVRWEALSRRWEAALSETGDDDTDFARFRASLWRRGHS